MKYLILTDTETQGLTPSATCQAIEVAVVVFDVETACVRESFASLIYATENPVADINKISVAALAKAPQAATVWRRVNAILSDIDGPCAYVAHRAEFDRGFYPADLAGKFPWICSKFHIEWPLSKPGASLVEVALAHDVPVHANHRALTDALLLAKVLTRVVEFGHDLPTLITEAMRPRIRVVADVPRSQNELLKEHSFRWDPERSQWWREMVREEIAALPFANDVRECP